VSAPTATSPRLWLSPEELRIVEEILEEIVPDRTVVVFGSRAGGNPKPFSDLDLAILGDEPLTLEVAARLSEAFSDSALPWKVDVVDWERADPAFRGRIQDQCVPLRSGRD
jgi:predicted nucleotidyltransferase